MAHGDEQSVIAAVLERRRQERAADAQARAAEVEGHRKERSIVLDELAAARVLPHRNSVQRVRCSYRCTVHLSVSATE